MPAINKDCIPLQPEHNANVDERLKKKLRVGYKYIRKAYSYLGILWTCGKI